MFALPPIEVPLSSVVLSPAAESGAIARNIGFLPARTHQSPREANPPPWSVRFVHPPLPRNTPYPSRR
jgi:hypothetical protein